MTSFSPVVAGWAALGRAAGRVAGWTPARWHSRGGARVLVVAPHPDDEIGCGGTLLLHRSTGDEVHVLHVTDGRGSRAGGLGPDSMAEQRRREAGAATPLLGVRGCDWLGLREGEWDEGALVAALKERISSLAPDILYAPSRIDFHPEHVRVANCLARALQSGGDSRIAIRVYPIQVPLTPLLANLVAPIAPVASELFGAIRCYETQLGSLERLQRMKRYAAACYGLPQYAEEFWQLDPGAYTRMHVLSDSRVGGTFRGLRRRPLTDPLSYVMGRSARRRFREAVQPE